MKFTLNKKQIEVTDSWEAMNFSQYLKVLKMKGEIAEIISIITGLDYDYLKKATIKGLDKLLYASQFLNKPPEFITDKLTHIGKYKLPLNANGIFDIQFESLAQFEDMRQVFNKVPDRKQGETPEETLIRLYAHTESYATYCAIYLQKLRDGEYDGDKAMQMIPEIMTYPAGHVINAGSFFFVRLSGLLNGTPHSSRNSAPIQTRSTGKRSRKSSARTQRLTKYRGR